MDTKVKDQISLMEFTILYSWACLLLHKYIIVFHQHLFAETGQTDHNKNDCTKTSTYSCLKNTIVMSFKIILSQSSATII